MKFTTNALFLLAAFGPGQAGAADDKVPDSIELIPEIEPAQAHIAFSTNPQNPAEFCGRIQGNAGRFDPYGQQRSVSYSAQQAPVAQARVQQRMDIAFPGDIVVVNGVTGVLDNHCNLITPSSSGDPHFRTWGGDKYDFHGACDLVLLRNPSYSNGLGLNVHIRTKINNWWSYIEKAVIQIGDHTLEIKGDEGWYWFNGEKEGHMVQTGDASLGDFAVRFRRINDHQTQTRISIGDGNAISIESFKKFVRVNVNRKTAASFNGSAGLLGSFPGGKMIARDGVTIVHDTNEFGQEWMVRSSEPILFHDTESTESPLKCTMPDVEAKKDARRRLGESAITTEQAAEACAHVAQVDRDICIFDVMATNDKDMAGSY